MPGEHTLGDLVEIDDRTVLVIGQELDVAHEQPDVGHALVHRAGEYLVLVDTGVTEAFRAALRTAVDRVGPRSRLLLLTTHGHTDHVGNNDLVDELAAERGVPAEHWVPARDLAQMRDPVTYWEHAFERIAGVAPLPAPPTLSAKKIVSLFQPLRPFGATTRAYEERPLERLRLGSARMTGWSFADGAVGCCAARGTPRGTSSSTCAIPGSSTSATRPTAAAGRCPTPTSSSCTRSWAPSPPRSPRARCRP